VLLKLHNVFWFCDKLHTKASSGFANKQGMKLQRCADCVSEAEHCQKALNKPGSNNNSTISVATGPFHGYHFFKKNTCIFIMRVTIIHCISDFSFRYVMYNVIKMYNYFFHHFSRLLPCLEVFGVFRRLLGNLTDHH